MITDAYLIHNVPLSLIVNLDLIHSFVCTVYLYF